MTASVESIIAAVLGRHQPLISVDYPTGLVTAVACDCDTTYRDLTTHAAHQAAAVLAALQEAGAVEWGVRYEDGSPLQRCYSEAYAKECHDDNLDGGPTIVSRLTLPWEPVKEVPQ